MAAITLVEAAKLAMDAGETKRAGVISLYAEKSDFLMAMKFLGIAGNALAFTQEGDLPATAFRGVNEGFTAANGSFSPQKESLYIAGGDLDVDRFIVRTQGDDVRAQHEALKVKALAQSVSLQIITGDTTSDPRGFDGVQKRSTGAQLVAAGASAGGDALSLKLLDTMIDQVDSPTHLLMSRAMRRKFVAAFRSSTFPNGLFQIVNGTDGGQGKQLLSYNDLPILTGYKQTKNAAILPFSEANPGGGSAVGSSIYCVNFSEDGLVGISNGGIDVRDLGELQSAPVFRTRVEWYLGLVAQSPFCAARLWGIKDADIVA
jgi:hypothetical protein